ncbi:MAG TPA: NIL domain-containing protein, partial [Symbiobacteriaceae bacterium]|nr:NIL domain-containing protein [Symbiobacteriaceae bacterium]
FYEPFHTAAWNGTPGATLIALSFVGDMSGRPLISAMAKRFGVDANIIEGAVERVGETRVGRLLLELTGESQAVQGALTFLREQGLTPEVMSHV